MEAISDLVSDPPRYSFGGADWNLTERRQDSNGAHDHFASTPQAREAFSKLSKHYDWTEIYQPNHTRVSAYQGSSHLDRIYSSHSG